ncbi:hypothetical protein GCM10010168_89210 [Actinoplanes ianthinogenes]|uniref:FtsX extracellular domain-containing protein n=1 Tax=Actinoplanes ianthinogenes TaxID=122358 RepID=A0ABM7LPW3_9ACTN|nr:permease-like cell division protein FtsX [Actinoplanes ianthinogenes]BCJ41319.1 hypothetical protein Aiant_19760 [Actinoplanes ianthinogenes]GGR56426.1 hypothetical protein GCM10010168_89210 [Actinoplanes ianthinogenes]
MSDVSVQPGEPAEKPAPKKAPSGRFLAPEPAPQPARGWLLPALIALVIGAGATFGGLWLAGWRKAPEHQYNVLVVLKLTATQEQKDAAQATLTGLPGRTSDVVLVSKAESYANAQKVYAGTEELKKLTEATTPESFKVNSTAVSFDCAPLLPLAENKGVSSLSVVQLKTDDEPAAKLTC